MAPLRRRVTLLLFALSTGCWALGAAAQNDPFYARVRGLTDAPYPSFQGSDCTTIKAPRPLVWRVLTAPAPAGNWLLAELNNVVPRGGRYKNGFAASKNDVLTIQEETLDGPRSSDFRVLVAEPERILSLTVIKDDDVMSHDLTKLTYTLFLESNPDGSTDVTWATHYDPSSPFAAVLSGVGSKRIRIRREMGLLVLKALSEAAASMPYPPLPDVAPDPKSRASR